MSHDFSISFPVGEGAQRVGGNREGDVRKIQILLQEVLSLFRRPGLIPFHAGSIPLSGFVDAATIAAIRGYQQNVLKIAQPDGVITPDGPVLKSLCNLAGLAFRAGLPILPLAFMDLRKGMRAGSVTEGRPGTTAIVPLGNSQRTPGLTKEGLKALEVSKDPRIRAFLDMVAWAEGVAHGYNTRYGNIRFKDLSDHPRIVYQGSSAAGRYQFLSRTWDKRKRICGLKDFGPESQDIAATFFLVDKGIDILLTSGDPLKNGNLEKAIIASSGEWASLPKNATTQKSAYKTPDGKKLQRGQRLDDLRSVYEQSLNQPKSNK